MSAEIGRRGGIAPADAYAALQTKLEELDAYTHTVLHQFPRIERHLLCADMRGAMNRMQRLLATAWKRRQKAAALFDMGRVRQRVNAFTAYTKHCNAKTTTASVLRELDSAKDKFLL